MPSNRNIVWSIAIGLVNLNTQFTAVDPSSIITPVNHSSSLSIQPASITFLSVSFLSCIHSVIGCLVPTNNNTKPTCNLLSQNLRYHQLWTQVPPLPPATSKFLKAYTITQPSAILYGLRLPLSVPTPGQSMDCCLYRLSSDYSVSFYVLQSL